jgi:RNA polymerase sigma-70 factor (sigma-E family)
MTLFRGAARDGSVAFELFAASSSTRLMRAAYLLCGDHQTAEDLLQMAMMRTARRWSRACRAPEAYARAVLVNLARDHVRRAQSRVDEVLGQEEAGARTPPGLVADHAELLAGRDAVMIALACLPQRQREVVVFRFYADLSVADTAVAIGASEGTVMSYTSRALTHLRDLLGDCSEAPDVATKTEVQHDPR